MTTSLTQTNNTLEYGVMGSILSITPNYNHSFIVFYSSKGINEGVREWDQTMQKAYNRTNQLIMVVIIIIIQKIDRIMNKQC
jgi:hypothetical protein